MERSPAPEASCIRHPLPFADSPHNGGVSRSQSPRRSGLIAPSSCFSPGSRPSVYKTAELELGNHLRPDRDHPDEQRDRGECGGFFHENPEHGLAPSLERMKNIVLISF